MGEREGQAVRGKAVEEFSERTQRKAEQHLDACLEAMDAHEWGSDDPVESPAFAPFDGCNTCIVREVLLVCWDEMMEEARREVRAEAADLASGALPGLSLVRKGDALCAQSRTGDD